MKALLIVTAVLEVAVGALLAASPSAPVSLLLGAPLDAPVARAVARIGGVALVSLGVACWMARGDVSSLAARGLLAGLLLYNLGAVAVLATHGLSPGPSGPGCWPAVGLHVALSAWCVRCLVPKRR